MTIRARGVPYSTRLSGFGAAPASGVALPGSDVEFTTNARSVYVAQVQTILKSRGYDPGDVDGVVGPRTVMALQAAMERLAHSLSPDARAAVASSGSSAAGLAQSLSVAFAYDDELRQDTGSPSQPVAPDALIPMGPGDVAGMERELGLGAASAVPWGWIGLGAAALVGGAIYFARR